MGQGPDRFDHVEVTLCGFSPVCPDPTLRRSARGRLASSAPW